MINESGDVCEGFICPICMKCFSRVDLIEQHYKEHTQSTNKNLSILKGNPTEESNVNHAFYSQPSSFNAEFKSLTHEFRVFRNAAISSMSAKLNTTILNLESLVEFDQSSSNLSRRGEDAKLCPSCGVSFGLGTEVDEDEADIQVSKLKDKMKHIANRFLDTDVVYRRKHHCRLCGFVLCSDCSYLMSEIEIKKLLEMIKQNSYEFSLRAEFEFALKADLKSEYINYKDDNSSETSSVFGYKLRLCFHCLSMIETKLAMSEMKSSKTPFFDLYNKLYENIAKINEEFPEFMTATTSLLYVFLHLVYSRNGESTYTRNMVESMRLSIVQSFQKVDVLGRELDKMIANISENISGGNTQGSSIEKPKQENISTLRLMRSVSRMYKRFVQNKLPLLQGIPSEEEYAKKVTKRKNEACEKWLAMDKEEENLKKAAEKQNNAANSLKQPIIEQLNPRVSPNWVPSTEKHVIKDYSKYGIDFEDDELVTLIQQIELVMGFIEDAKQAGRSEDEIQALSKNLTELQLALSQKQMSMDK